LGVVAQAGPDTDVPSPADVEQAELVLRDFLAPTPLQRSRVLSDAAGGSVHLKLESVQPTRSFKVRGALNRLSHIEAETRAAGVITASAGNHGLGVAYAAAAFDAPATVFVPVNANPNKVDAIRRLGARVVAAGENYAEANVAALEAQRESAATFVHAYDDPQVIAGQGTVALELVRDLDDFDTVLVGVGGGGLIGGVAMYLKEKRPRVKVVGVEPTGADAMRRSLRAGAIVTLDRVGTIADGLAASAPGLLTFDLARRYVDEVLLVGEDEMLQAIRRLFEWEHLLSEPAGAAALAALLFHYRPRPKERIVVIVSGANVATDVLLRTLQ